MNQINVSKAREQIKSIVQQVSSDGKPVIIANRNKPAVILVPYDAYKALLQDRPEYNGYMAIMFARRFLFDAPTHMILSQQSEFEKLSPLQLCALIEIESLPIPKSKRATLIKIVGKKIIARLEKRKAIANYISKAKGEGIYEIEEHKTGMIEL